MSNLEQLLQQARGLNAVQQRKIAVVLGSVVADTAVRPVHWIYDAEKLASILQDKQNPEFLDKNYCPFYSIDIGLNSCYGDEIVVALDGLYKSNGSNVYQTHVQTLFDFFSKEDGEYQVALKKRPNGYPVPGPWIQKPLLEFIDNFNKQQEPYGSATEQDNDCIFTTLPLVAQLANKEFNEAEVEKFMKVVINNSSLSFGLTITRLLNNLIVRQENSYSYQNLYNDLNQIVPEDLKAHIQTVYEGKDVPHIDFVNKNGKGCPNPGSFLGALHTSFLGGSYVEAIRATIKAGGNNCSRGIIAGAIYAAIEGLDGIPLDWIKQTKQAEKVLEQCLKVYGK